MTDQEATAAERIATGVPGLDVLLEGGLLRGGVYILEGPPGAGKTTLANQMCYAAARRSESAIYVTLLAESHARMLTHLRRMAFFDAGAIPDKVYYLSAFKVLEGDGLQALQATVRKVITSRSASLVVIDGLTAAEHASPSPTEYKKFIRELQTITAMTGCAALLLASTERPHPFRPEQTMVDGVIELGDELAKLRPMRHLQIRKLRGSAPIRGKHTLLISDEGVTVVPRLETQHVALDEDQFTPGAGRMGFGVDGLDAMLEGGLTANSVTMLLGPSGSGKTILGLQFLAEGARNHEPGVYFGFYETPRALREKSKRVRLGIAEAEKEGLVDLVWTRPVEGTIDLLGERLFSAIRSRNARRLVIDGIHGFQIATDAPDRIRDVFSTISNELERGGVTTLYTVETPDLFGPRIESPIVGLSTLTHNIILLRHVELRAHLYRLISILKIRDSDYDSAIREFRITNEGVVVADTFESADQVLSGMARPAVSPAPAKLPGKRGARPKTKRSRR